MGMSNEGARDCGAGPDLWDLVSSPSLTLN